jgi:hypothetical protein
VTSPLSNFEVKNACRLTFMAWCLGHLYSPTDLAGMDLQNLYSSHNIVRVFKLRRMRWVGHVIYGGNEKCIQNLLGNHKRQR